MAFNFKKNAPLLAGLGGGAIGAATLGTKTGRNFLFGKSPRTEQVDRLNPEQQQALSQLLGMGLSNIEDPYQGFQPIADQAISRFEQQGVPSLAERFTSMGQGAQRSSDFMGALGSARAGLEENLAGLQAQYGMQNKQLGSQLAGLGLTPSFESIYRPEDHGFLGSLGSSASSYLPMLLKLLF